MKVLVTGGAGFIGSNFVRYLLRERPDFGLVVLDKLTYSGNRANLADCEEDGRVEFVQGDICDRQLVERLVPRCELIVNFAAETHVDRSILDSGDFVKTDVEGTRTLLDVARLAGIARFAQISTDEVYGDIPITERSGENDALRPRSPYAASKAAGDLMVQAYHTTYGLDTVITRASNNFGPFQFPEKLIPLFVTNAFDSKPLPVYGDGLQERDWLFVDDHCAGLLTAIEHGQSGQVYNIGAGAERPNIDVVNEILRLTGRSQSLITHVADRLGHDRRYAMDCSKMHSLGWAPRIEFTKGLERTVEWYRTHENWWRSCRQGEFDEYYERQYGARLQEANA